MELDQFQRKIRSTVGRFQWQTLQVWWWQKGDVGQIVTCSPESHYADYYANDSEYTLVGCYRGQSEEQFRNDLDVTIKMCADDPA